MHEGARDDGVPASDSAMAGAFDGAAASVRVANRCGENAEGTPASKDAIGSATEQKSLDGANALDGMCGGTSTGSDSASEYATVSKDNEVWTSARDKLRNSGSMRSSVRGGVGEAGAPTSEGDC